MFQEPQETFKNTAHNKIPNEPQWHYTTPENKKKTGALEDIFAEHFSIPASAFAAKIKNIEHHRSHLASAFFASPYEKSAVLSVDAFGDFCSTMLAVGEGNKITVLEQVLFPHSIGIFYTAFTQYLGFKYYGDEYKVMGLAPYGKPVYLKEMSEILILEKDGLFKLNLDYFIHHKKVLLLEYLRKMIPLQARYIQKNWKIYLKIKKHF